MTLGEAMVVEWDVVGLSPLSEIAMMGEDREVGDDCDIGKRRD